jgi:serine protease inhibitor
VAPRTIQPRTIRSPILPPGNYSRDAAVIANVVYFKGGWSSAFPAKQTVARAFTSGDGTQTSVQMMQQRASFPYLQGSGFQVLRLPYGQGRLSMLVVLPAAGTDINTFVSGITAASLAGWESQLQTAYGDVALPRFSTRYSGSLSGALTTLGMGVAFSPNDADFSGIAPLTYISDVAHGTVIEVDESGTTAAGATTVTVTTTVVMDPQFTMTMDHPFFYAIVDDQSGELLFVGVVANPDGG